MLKRVLMLTLMVVLSSGRLSRRYVVLCSKGTKKLKEEAVESCSSSCRVRAREEQAKDRSSGMRQRQPGPPAR